MESHDAVPPTPERRTGGRRTADADGNIEAVTGIAVRAAARRAGTPLSTWVAQALGAKVRAEALAALLDGWEAEHGAFTEEELARAERELGLSGPQTP